MRLKIVGGNCLPSKKLKKEIERMGGEYTEVLPSGIFTTKTPQLWIDNLFFSADVRKINEKLESLKRFR